MALLHTLEQKQKVKDWVIKSKDLTAKVNGFFFFFFPYAFHRKENNDKGEGEFCICGYKYSLILNSTELRLESYLCNF